MEKNKWPSMSLPEDPLGGLTQKETITTKKSISDVKSGNSHEDGPAGNESWVPSGGGDVATEEDSWILSPI